MKRRSRRFNPRTDVPKTMDQVFQLYFAKTKFILRDMMADWARREVRERFRLRSRPR